MKIRAFLLCLVISFDLAAASAQSLSGIQLGDKLSDIPGKLGFPATISNETGPFSLRKWTLPDGNDISVTASRSDGLIVYIETNWGGKQSGAVSDFPGFTYGSTSLDEVRRAFGSNGFMFGERGAFETPDRGVAGSNSFDVDGATETIATFITKMSGEDVRRFANSKRQFGSLATLDTIILARPAYLEGLWGGARKYDPAYKRIRWVQVSSASAGTVAEPSRKPARRNGPFEGSWGLSAEECADKEGPNANMLIEWPWVHRYENHCRRVRTERDNASTIVVADCEFGDEKGRGVLRFTPIDADTIAAEFALKATGMRGKEQRLYKRCTRS